jgi:hypothetical protein
MKFEDYILDVSVKKERRRNKAIYSFKGIFKRICGDRSCESKKKRREL